VAKLNVLFYEASSGFGGSGSNLYHILKNLDIDTFFPIVVIHNRGPQFKRIESAGFRVIEIPFKNAEDIDNAGKLLFLFLFIFRVIPLSFKLLFFIWRENIKLIHINTNIISGIPMIIAGRLSNRKVFCHVRQTRKLIRRESFFVRFINQFLILNKAALKTYQNDIPQNKINIVYDGIDLGEFNDVHPEKFKNEFELNSSRLVGMVGRIVEGKGQKEFILAAKCVIENMPDVKFVVVGDSKGGDKQYFSEVKKLTEKNGLTENVIFTGWRNDIKDIISGLDIMVLASTTFPEGMPNVIIEAMALQKPVIVTNIPGPSEVVVDSDTGFIVPPGDIEAMVEKMMYLLKNPDVAKTMGVRGRKRAEEVFNVTDEARKIEEIYRRALSRS